MPRKNYKKTLNVALGALITVSLAVAITAYMTRAFNEKVPPGPGQSVSRPVPSGAITGQLEWKTKPKEVGVVGTVRSRSTAEIASKVLARITKVHVRAGDHVEAGQVLVELDARELAAQTNSASAALRAAEADLRLADKEFHRARSLFSQGAGTGRDVDLATARRDAAKARMRVAESGVTASASTLDYTRLTAPADGKIIERAAEPGDMASPGQPLLTMYDPIGLRVEAHVRESLLPYVSVGTRLRVEVEATGFETTGPVEEIVPQAAAATRTFIVKIGISHAEGLYPGMFGRAYIPTGEERLLIMPYAARQQLGQVEFAQVVTADGLQRRQITTGRRFDDELEVLSGLMPTEEEPVQLLLH